MVVVVVVCVVVGLVVGGGGVVVGDGGGVLVRGLGLSFALVDFWLFLLSVLLLTFILSAHRFVFDKLVATMPCFS